MEEFLPWIKNRYVRLHGQSGFFNLMNSGICEPRDVLRHLLDEQRSALAALLAESNEWGHPALRAALRRRYELPPETDFVLTAGATAGFWLTCRALLSPGDRVLVEMPVYEPLRLVPARLGAQVDFLPRRAESAYQVDPSEVAQRMTPRTRLVILTNLHNPTGAALDEEVLQQVAEAARSRSPEARVVVDETFHDFLPQRPKPAARLGPAFITVNTLTKVYGLGLLRCGWVLADAEVLARVRAAWLDVAGIGSRLTEALAALALDQSGRLDAHWQSVLAGNRPMVDELLGPLVKEGLLQGNVTPPGCICFPKVVGVADTVEWARRLAADFGVYVVPGEFFLAPGHVRLGFGGDPAVLAGSLARLAEALCRQIGSRHLVQGG
jgi:aspartate/methionine/tyrosine aminotransferase